MRMFRNVNYGKIAVVIFLTLLIWVWADRALDEDFTVSNVTLSIAKSANPGIWASFSNEPSVSIDKVVLRGSASKIANVKRRLNDGSLVLEFFLDPEQEAMTAARQYDLAVLDFLKRSDQIRQLGLTVRSCEPDEITVNVVQLVKRPLDIVCVDENRNPVKAAVEPAQIEMLVPSDWMGEKLIAKVQLTRRELNQARSSAIEKTPYIELAAGQKRDAQTPVKIATLSQESRLSDFTITTATLGFTLSANLQGKYKVEITNLNELIRAVTIRATPEAKRAYDQMRYQLILEIDDSDKDIKSDEPLRKELTCNFPPEYVRRDEIVLNQQPVIARFNLLPLVPEQPAPAGGK